MATNPMQRKARNSFLLGMFITLIITGVIIGVLAYLLVTQQKAQQAEENLQVDVVTLKTDVKSGQIITSDMLEVVKVPAQIAPATAVADAGELENYSVAEKLTGNPLETDKDGLFFKDATGNIVRAGKDEASGKYYKVVNNQKTVIEVTEVPLVAKTALSASTVLTLDLVNQSDEVLDDDLRLVDYNMLSIPVKINPDDYIDVRFTLPSGEDYIVVSKKRVVDVLENTVWLKMTEEEILKMSNAIVEAYVMTGSKLTVALYVEPGLQTAATSTYVTSEGVYNLIQKDPNITEVAKKTLETLYNGGLIEQRTKNINSQLGIYADEAKSNIEARVQEEVEARRELREKYLEELSAQAATAAAVEAAE